MKLYTMLSAAGRRSDILILRTGAAEKAVPPQNGVGNTTLLGETAYASSIGCWQRFVARLPEPISHTRCLAASPSGPGRPAEKVALESSSAHFRVARPH